MMMMGLMGVSSHSHRHPAQQPLDFTMAPSVDRHSVVLDLRKIKGETEVDSEDVYDRSSNQVVAPINSEQKMLQQSPMPMVMNLSPPSPSEACFPTSTFFSGPAVQGPHRIHVDSSEDGLSEGGSVSPPSITSIGSPFSLTNSFMHNRVSRSGKPTRPFKAYPKDPLALPAVTSADAILGHTSTEAYTEFRRRMLSQVQAVTGCNVSNAKMKRSVSPQMPPDCSDADGKDAAYWERRRKNNEAAKRSRDARRAKEDEIAIRAAFLEQENIQLKYENASLRNEAAKLRCLLYNR